MPVREKRIFHYINPNVYARCETDDNIRVVDPNRIKKMNFMCSGGSVVPVW